MHISGVIPSQSEQIFTACTSGLQDCFRVVPFPILMAWMTLEKWLQTPR